MPAVVLARSITDQTPKPKFAGETISWGGELRAIHGGGDIEVTSLSSAGAMLRYSIVEKRVIEAGGGSLIGGGTILVTPDGRIIRIPPGDPLERQIGRELGGIAAVVQRIRGSYPFEYNLGHAPTVVGGGVTFRGGGALLFARDGRIEIAAGDRVERVLEPSMGRLATVARGLAQETRF
jgi:hypothetical protein